jgi:hypothetical protein
MLTATSRLTEQRTGQLDKMSSRISCRVVSFVFCFCFLFFLRFIYILKIILQSDLAAAKGITNHINSVVIFRDDAGVDHQYPFEPVVLQAPVLPASVASVAPAKTGGAKRRSTKTRPARAVLRTAAAWSSTLGLLLLLLTAVEHANLATTPTGFFPMGVGSPKIGADTFDTVAADATRAMFDASFDQTVEWHDPYLDPDMPSSFSDWSPVHK